MEMSLQFRVQNCHYNNAGTNKKSTKYLKTSYYYCFKLYFKDVVEINFIFEVWLININV